MDLQTLLQESGATSLLKRAVELDKEDRLDEALSSYIAGLEQMMTVMKGMQNCEAKQQLRSRVNEYMDRVETLRKVANMKKEAEKRHEEIHIEDGSVGHSYEDVFKRYLDSSVTEVEVEDPYVRSHHQVCNFVRFCEMLLTSTDNIRSIKLVTGADSSSDGQRTQSLALSELVKSLQQHGVELKIEYLSTLHDREVRFNNGWIIKIGRGLDYFKSSGKYCIGFYNMSLRKCHETTINVFHKKFTKGS